MRGIDQCPKCGGESSVIDTRRLKTGPKRRRSCDECKFRWSTVEISCSEYDTLKDVFNRSAAMVEVFNGKRQS